MNLKSKNAPLVIGLLLIIFVIAVIIGLAVLPNKLYQPTYSFLYTYKDEYYPTSYQEYTGYEVNNGKLEEKTTLIPTDVPSKLPIEPLKTPFQEKIYIYEPDQGASRELTFEEAQALNLDSNTISPDGFELGYGNSSNGFLLFTDVSNDYNSRYLIGHGARHKVNLIQDSRDDVYNRYYNLKFLGWVK